MRDLSDRIAVCFSGQIRTGVENSSRLLSYFKESLDIIDFFIHTWDIDTQSPWAEENNQNLAVRDIETPVPNEKFLMIEDTYKPLDMRVDNYSIYKKCHHRRTIQRSNICSQTPMFHSIWESNQLKKSHELLCNSKYDLVVRMRFDILPHHRFIDEIQFIRERRDYLYCLDFMNKLPNQIEDVCWIATSDIMDKVSDFIIERETTPMLEDSQTHMSRYLKTNGIDCKQFKDNNLTIFRQKTVI